AVTSAAACAAAGRGATHRPAAASRRGATGATGAHRHGSGYAATACRLAANGPTNGTGRSRAGERSSDVAGTDGAANGQDADQSVSRERSKCEGTSPGARADLRSGQLFPG